VTIADSKKAALPLMQICCAPADLRVAPTSAREREIAGLNFPAADLEAQLRGLADGFAPRRRMVLIGDRQTEALLIIPVHCHSEITCLIAICIALAAWFSSNRSNFPDLRP